VTPVSEMRMIHERIEKSELLVISDAGHASQYEKMKEFNSAVLDFIGRNS
jgi:pimeloyl-ACP methyl ester carboxylesterase